VRRRVVKIIAGTVATFAVALGGLTSAWLAGVHVPLASGTTYMKIQKLQIANNAAAPDGTFFILLVGSDLRPGVGGARGDALHLVGVNPSQNAASMIDIPRDTCFNGDRINSYNTNGPRSQADAVSALTGGTPISYVIEVDFAGFTSIIDGMGGITVDVPMPMNDRYSGAVFSPGVQHLNGGQALAFSRNRHDFPNSDLQRTVNQGTLLINALRSMQTQANNAAGEFKLLALFGRHAKLEGVGLKDLYRMGRIAHRIDPGSVRNVAFPTGGGACLATGGGAASLLADFRDDAVLQVH
jgi:polyisoprenyl-teichoic acid--peptidoglycan teichoic acid transferase